MIRKEFEEIYQKNLKEIDIPYPWKDQLECISCLKERRDTKTLLVYNRQDGKKYILKIAEGAKKDTLVQENEALLKLFDEEKHYFPSPGILIREEAASYYLREYVEGNTLITVLKRHGCMPEPVLIGTGIRLCRILEVLHSQQPPLIHRDIKPENIVFTKEHTFTLIDFGTARRYCPGKDHDTLVMGSRPTAAPEQFGYCQTDIRTDIYGLGMTLLYLASGSFDKKELKNVPISGQLKRMIRKTTAFDPRSRYRDAAQLRRALTRLGRSHLRRRTYGVES